MADGDNADLLAKLDWKSFTPADSPKGLPDIMKEQGHLATPDVAPGEPAFDFELPVFDPHHAHIRRHPGHKASRMVVYAQGTGGGNCNSLDNIFDVVKAIRIEHPVA